MNYEGDILEHALNFGIESSSNRFNESVENVLTIVREFKNQIEEPCSCAKSRLPMLCFICDKQTRVNI